MNNNNRKLRIIFGAFFISILLGLSSCATYYQKNLEFQEAYSEGDMTKAEKILGDKKKSSEGKNRLLFFLEKGVVLHMQGEYEQSNVYLERAYTFLEDYKVSYSVEALSLISNASIKTYVGEDHERVLLHYYKALNYLKLGKASEALVECRRLNIKLNALNDKYKDKKNRYQNDAFAHILMGLAYELNNDVNNAFIAYRNAYNSYKDSYSKSFGVITPKQLKNDLLRTAYLNGFVEELKFYEREFSMTYNHEPTSDGELIFFWHNGLGPVKSEWSINFTVVRGEGGDAFFVNESMGLRIPYRYNDDIKEKKGGLGDLKVVRVAFPKYLVRKAVFENAVLWKDSVAFPLEKAENIEGIALSVLEDRMLRELATSLARLALKQAAEEAARNESDEVGSILSILNALTEKADTRNWQTLPNSISYSRIPLSLGTNEITFKSHAFGTEMEPIEEKFTFELVVKTKLFHVYSTLDSYAPSNH